MSTIKEIEDAIQTLPPSEVSELASWLQAYEDRLWDEQLDEDAEAGRLDKLIEEADRG
ncbi:MAG TPA: hypothetical protein VKX17_05715 [Planctomycetota bacterium]|nr:hypothetical protein [Planctomycetota bacterium]